MNTAFLKSFETLQKVYNDGAFSTISLNEMLNRCFGKERALVTKIVYGVLDNDIYLNYLIGKFVKKMPKSDTLVFLKIGAYCLTKLSIPQYAVVNDVAELAKLSGDRRTVGFVNATLKTIATNYKCLQLPSDAVECASVVNSYPLWALKKLVRDYGEQKAIDIVSAHVDNKTVVRFVVPTTKRQAEQKFGCEVEETVFDNVFKVDGRVGAPDETFTVQSLGSMAISQIAAAYQPTKMLDVCSAPGGKSIYIKQLCPSAEITSCDVHPHRVELIKAYSKRMNVQLTTCVADATVFAPQWEQAFDLVLVDAPCSGFGVLDNHPDIKLFRQEKDVSDIMKLQRDILANACKYVAKDGRLVYSTCTLFDHENGQQIKRFLANHPDFVAEKIVLPQMPDVDGKTQYQFLPNEGMQGFFVAVLRKI